MTSDDELEREGLRTMVITSHVNNARARDRLFDSLRDCFGFDDTDFIVAVGGHAGGEYVVTREGNVTTVLCPHNSIDFTGLIALLEVPCLRRKSYFYMHDTCEAGPDFLTNVVPEVYPYDTASFAFHSMNMGVYSWKALDRHRDLITSFRNEDLSPGAAKRAKKRCVLEEDAVFRANKALGLHVFVDRADPGYETVRDVYGTGVKRVTNWCPIVDLYKHKANWTNKADYELGL